LARNGAARQYKQGQQGDAACLRAQHRASTLQAKPDKAWSLWSHAGSPGAHAVHSASRPGREVR
jgi:hypothetical protein